MAEHGMQISLSNSSSDDSSDQQTPYTIAGERSGGSSHRQTPPSAVSVPPPSKKPRGRPPGSRNKPKPPLVITQDNEQAMKPAVIEVSAGTDVLEAVIQYALRRRCGVTILSGSGTIANVTLRYPLSRAPAFTLHGPFTLLTLTGTFMCPPSPPPVPVPFPLPLASSSSSNPNPPPPPPPPQPQLPPSTFGITLAGIQGQIFGGVIGGKVVAGGDGVQVMATLFKNPELHRAGGVIEVDEEGDDDNPNASGGGGGGGGSTSGGGGGSESMSGFNVVNPTPLNCQAPSDPNFMQWGHPRPPNY